MKPVTLEYYGDDISGNETDSILFSGNWETVSKMVTMVNGQVFTILVSSTFSRPTHDVE